MCTHPQRNGTLITSNAEVNLTSDIEVFKNVHRSHLFKKLNFKYNIY